MRSFDVVAETRRLDAIYPFLLVDALFIKSRDDDRVVSCAALIVSGIPYDGIREILGVRIGDTESCATWDGTFRWLNMRSLAGVMFVNSDNHGGMTHGISSTSRVRAGSAARSICCATCRLTAR